MTTRAHDARNDRNAGIWQGKNLGALSNPSPQVPSRIQEVVRNSPPTARMHHSPPKSFSAQYSGSRACRSEIIDQGQGIVLRLGTRDTIRTSDFASAQHADIIGSRKACSITTIISACGITTPAKAPQDGATTKTRHQTDRQHPRLALRVAKARLPEMRLRQWSQNRGETAARRRQPQEQQARETKPSMPASPTYDLHPRLSRLTGCNSRQ